MRLSSLISHLQELEKIMKKDFKIKDPKVVMSSDGEGNSYGSISADSFTVDKQTKSLIIYPLSQSSFIGDL